MMMPIVDAVLAEILTTRCSPDELELASSSEKSTEISLLEKGRQCNGNSDKLVQHVSFGDAPSPTI